MKISVKVKTGCKKQDIIEGGALKVNLKSQPENNKANLELVKVLSKYFKKKVKIVKGFTSKNKIVEV